LAAFEVITEAIWNGWIAFNASHGDLPVFHAICAGVVNSLKVFPQGEHRFHFSW
jgi:hypothetical protein